MQLETANFSLAVAKGDHGPVAVVLAFDSLEPPEAKDAGNSCEGAAIAGADLILTSPGQKLRLTNVDPSILDLLRTTGIPLVGIASGVDFIIPIAR